MSDGNLMPAEPDAHLDKKRRLDDKYDEVDKQINSDIAGIIGNVSNLSDVGISVLLDVIRDHSDRQMSRVDTIQVLEEHTDLKDKLRAAWAAKSYRKILELDYLKSSSDSDSGPRATLSLEETAWAKDVEKTQMLLQETWKKPFRGDCHTVLLEKINAMYQPEAYSNICAILQSSGTGKSRMVDELGKSVYTLPINIRTRVGTNAAYPPTDDVLRRHLVLGAPWNSEGRCRTHYQTFFGCLFLRSLEELSMLDKSNDFADAWYHLMDNAIYRRNFYESVVKLTKSPIDAHSALANLTAKLQERSTYRKIHMLIYIDEAHELLDESCCRGYTKLDAMCSVISNFCEQPLFFLLLSTQSSLRFFPPIKEPATSELVRMMSRRLLAPITETPFDCFPEVTVNPGVLHVEELSTLEHIAMWGRPLWWTMVPEGAERLIGFARMKLLCHHGIDRPFRSMENRALIAILDVLLAFDFQPNGELNEDIQARLVTKHMRIAYSVPQHRLYFQSGYPSEPLLAEAAAQQLFKFQRLDGGNSFDVMAAMIGHSTLLSSTLIDTGKRGEVFMRVCLMRAYMDGVLQGFGPYPSGVIFSTGCKLTTFIEQLFEPQYARMVLDAKPDNLESNKTFSQAFAHSMVRFTHFVKAGDEYAMTSEALFGAFARGMAFIGYQTHQAVDFAIPVLLNKEDTLQESAMSAILIQLKKRVKGRGPEAYSFSEEEVGLFPPQAEVGKSQGEGKGKGKEKEGLNDERPYITLVAEVCIEPEKGKEKDIKTPAVHISEQPESIRNPDVHPRYAIAAYGGTGVYKYVTTSGFLPSLLTTRDFFADRPHYQVARSHDLQMRLKPTWRRGENSYHWLDSELLRQTN